MLYVILISQKRRQLVGPQINSMSKFGTIDQLTIHTVFPYQQICDDL